MPVKINSVNFFSELQGVSDDPVNWLLANVGDKIRIELDFSVITSAIASEDKPIILNNTDGYLGNGWITDDSGRFADFRIGDLVSVDNYATFSNYGSFTIVDKLSENEIQLSANVPTVGSDLISEEVLLSIKNPITAARYKYNFIENSDQPSFNSKISGTEQMLVSKLIDANVTTPLNMEFIGEQSYQAGSATIQGVQEIPAGGATAFESEFKIIHETYITPFMLSAQWADILLGTAPDYFFNAKCLKGVFDIEAMYDYTDPNRIQTLQITETIGNTGWFNENFNSGVTNYKIDSVLYEDATPSTIQALELSTTAVTHVTAVIKNAVDTPFSNNNTKFVLNFCKAPNDESEYQLNGRTAENNFVFDRALQTVGSAAVNGDNFGGSMTVLKNVEATFNSSSQITLEFDVLLGADAIDIINESDNPRYMIWLSIQDHTLEMKNADKVSLLIDSDDFYLNNSDPGLVVINNIFLRHPESDPDSQGVEAGSISASDPAALVWNVNGGTPAIIYALADFGGTDKIIGNALWNTDMLTTLQDLVTSMNTNTDADPGDSTNMKANTGFTTFDNAAGYRGAAAFVSAKSQPNTLSWTVANTVGGATEVQILDQVTGKTIGNTNPNVDLDTAMADLVTSVNTNTQNGSLFNGAYPFGSAHGYTAAYNPSTNVFTLTPPANVGATYNGRAMFFAVNGGGSWTITPSQSRSWAGGINEVDTFTLTPPVGVAATINGQYSYLYSWTTPVITTVETAAQQWTGGFAGSTTYLDAFPNDELVAYTQFFIDSNGRTLADIKIKSIESKVKVKNSSTLDEFELDGFSLNTSNYPLVAGVLYFDFQLDRPFHVPNLSIRKMIQERRRDDLDQSGDYYFEVWYPFIMRWEYWEKLLIADSDFFDTSEDNNGFNEFWHHYQSGNWGLYYELLVTTDTAGVEGTYTLEVPIRSNNYNSNSAWNNKTIKTYDPDTNAQLLVGSDNYILGYKNTLVKATFNKISAPPVLSDCTVVFWLEVFEEGGVTGSRRYSSFWVADSDTWFKSIDGSDKVALSLVTNTITAQCLIDFTKIPAKASFKLTARLYEIALGGTGKDTELGVAKVIETGNFKIFE